MKLLAFITALLITLLTSRWVNRNASEGGRMKLMTFTIAILMSLPLSRRVTGNALNPLKEAL